MKDAIHGYNWYDNEWWGSFIIIYGKLEILIFPEYFLNKDNYLAHH